MSLTSSAAGCNPVSGRGLFDRRAGIFGAFALLGRDISALTTLSSRIGWRDEQRRRCVFPGDVRYAW